MKRLYFILLVSLVFAAGCKKNDVSRTSGTDTIDNTIYKSSTYYAYGFSFSKAAKVATTETPGPDIVLYVATDTQLPRLTFQANNYKDSFSKVGDYTDAASAITAFNSLLSVGTVQWTSMADPVTANQVWLYRTNSDQYVKMRIVSVVNETRNSVAFGACTFEWVFQPDGSTTFPGK
jgi:hypothetical protein